MASIKISDLRPAGSDLVSDSEGYMNDLVDGEISAIHGGFPGWGKIARAVAGTVVATAGVATGDPFLVAGGIYIATL